MIVSIEDIKHLKGLGCIKLKARLYIIISAYLNISLNIKKTHITKLENGFTFLKRRFILFKNGKIVLKPFKKNIRRYCKKILKLKKKNIDIKAVQISFVGLSKTI